MTTIVIRTASLKAASMLMAKCGSLRPIFEGVFICRAPRDTDVLLTAGDNMVQGYFAQQQPSSIELTSPVWLSHTAVAMILRCAGSATTVSIRVDGGVIGCGNMTIESHMPACKMPDFAELLSTTLAATKGLCQLDHRLLKRAQDALRTHYTKGLKWVPCLTQRGTNAASLHTEDDAVVLIQPLVAKSCAAYDFSGLRT